MKINEHEYVKHLQFLWFCIFVYFGFIFWAQNQAPEPKPKKVGRPCSGPGRGRPRLEGMTTIDYMYFFTLLNSYSMRYPQFGYYPKLPGGAT